MRETKKIGVYEPGSTNAMGMPIMVGAGRAMGLQVQKSLAVRTVNNAGRVLREQDASVISVLGGGGGGGGAAVDGDGAESRESYVFVSVFA